MEFVMGFGAGLGRLRRFGKFAFLAVLLMLAPAASAQDQGSAPAVPPGTNTQSLPSAVQSMLPPGMTPQQALDALKAQGISPDQVKPPTPPEAQQQILKAAVTPTAPQPSSSLEGLYAARLNHSIRQFGYDLVANGGTVASVLNGAVQDDYILGPGDEVIVTLQGQQNANYSARVDRDGRVIFPNLPPISAAGRPFGDFRHDLEAAAKRAYIQTQIYVSIGQIRQISVRVVGEVQNAGVYALTGLSTVLDALNLAGGVKKSGSLRNITIVRNGQPISVDLYALLLTHGQSPDMTITEGDRIVVPPIGSTVAITGDVRRPAIYELSPGRRAITERELMALANGTELRGIYREMIQRIDASGKEVLSDATGSPGAVVRDGEILFVYKSVSASLGNVTLTGSVRLPGIYALDRARTLHDLIPSAEALAPTPYMLLGVVERVDPQTLRRSLIPFSLLHVLEGKENLDLASGDTVRILTVDEMRALITDASQANPNTAWSQGRDFVSSQSQSALAPAASAPSVAPSVAGGAQAGEQGASASAGEPNGGLGDMSSGDQAFFGRVLRDYRVSLTGAVRNPGDYLVSPGTTLDEVIDAAGGLDSDADVSSFAVTSTLISNNTGRSATERQDVTLPPSEYHTIALKPLDVVEFHHVFTDMAGGSVSISGEVRYAGSYSIVRGEHLSQLLVRAGGLTSVAYPYGTVFLRPSVADIERAGFQRVADEVQRQMLTGVTEASGSQANAPSSDTIAATQTFIAELRSQKAIGRISIIADPSVLAAHPERDPILEPGDSIYVPQRPSTVTVLGDVMQPGSYPFDSNSSAEDYVDLAGGYGEHAEEDLTYIVYPDGTAQRLNRSWLRFGSQGVPPGSVIYVPRNLFPTNWIALTTSISDVVKDLAVSIASVAVLSK